MKIQGRKETCFLFFIKSDDNGDSKEIHFDLRDNTFYRYLKTGKTRELSTATVANFFRGFSFVQVTESFENPTFARLMRMCYDGKSSGRMKNFGTIFADIGRYLHLESYLAVGFEGVNRQSFKNPLSQFTKEVRKFMLELGANYWNNNWEEAYVKNPKLVNDLCAHVRRNHHLDLEVYRMLVDIVTSYRFQKFETLTAENGVEICNHGVVKEKCDRRHYDWDRNTIGFGCEYKALFDYMVRIVRTEAQSVDSVMTEYHDYLNMMREIELNKLIRRIKAANPDADVSNVKFAGYGRIEKYPQFLTVRHNIVAANHRALKQEFDDILFAQMADQNFSWSKDMFQIVVPTVSQDIKDEGAELHHCVGSYVKRVLDGNTQIVFMRLKDDADTSMVTVEIRDNKIIQARGHSNRDLEAAEREWLELYAKKKNLEYGKAKYDKSQPSPTPNPPKKVEKELEIVDSNDVDFDVVYDSMCDLVNGNLQGAA